MDLLEVSAMRARRSDMIGHPESDLASTLNTMLASAALHESPHHQLLSTHLRHHHNLAHGSALLGLSHGMGPLFSRELDSLVNSTGTAPYYPLLGGDPLNYYARLGSTPHRALHTETEVMFDRSRMHLPPVSREPFGMSRVGDLLATSGYPLHMQSAVLAGLWSPQSVMDLRFPSSGMNEAPRLSRGDEGIQLLGEAALKQLEIPERMEVNMECQRKAVLSETTAEEDDAQKREKRIYRHESFVEKLYRLLIDLEGQGKESVASFTSDGKGFCVHKPEEFVKDIVPKYFRHRKMSSFYRQLLLYKFDRVRDGPDRGSFKHKFFHRGREDLLKHIERDDKNDKLPIGYQKAIHRS